MKKIFTQFSFALVAPMILGFIGSASSAWAGGILYTIKAPANGQAFELYRVTATDGTPNTITFSPTPIATSSFTCTDCANTSRVNGFSYDTYNGNVFFFNSNPASPVLYYAPVAGGANSIQAVSGTLPTNYSLLNSLNLSGAAYYNSAIYAVANASSTLYKIPIANVGGVPQFNGGLISTFTLPAGGAGIFYGDIAISQDILYGFTTGSTNAQRLYYSFNLVNGSSTTPVSNSQQSMQISFGGSDQFIYAIDGSNNWYTIDPSVGTPSLYVTSAPPFTINDLAGAEVPGPLPLMGAAAAFHVARRLRSRIEASKAHSSR